VSNSATTLRIATRKSQLALWQAEHVAGLLRQAHTGLEIELVPISTKGDRIQDRSLAAIGGKGLFIKELETALEEHRADIAVHSLTKFLGGHGTTLGGAIVDSGRFDWTAQPRRFPAFNEPDESYHGLVYTRQFGASAYIQRARSVYQRTMGSVLSPFNAFLLLQGIETVALRVERHVENARKVAEFLRNDARVAWVNYAGFTDSPYYALVQKYLNGNASSLFTFGIKGGIEAGKTFYDSLKLITRLVNIGDAKSLACHPASTTHRQMSAEQQRMAGVLPETIRLSIGIEHASDIIEDIDQALAGASRAHPRLEAAE